MTEDEKVYFEKISDSLGTSFVEENPDVPKEIVEEIKEIETKTTEIQQTISNNVVLLKDQDYIDFELKHLISTTNNAMEKLESEIKIGASNSVYTTLCTLVNTKAELLTKLIAFNKMILDMTMFAPEEDNDKEEEMSLNVTSSDMLKFFKEIKKKSEDKQIEAEFTVEDAQ